MSQDLAEKIRAAAQAKNIDPDIALAIAKAESSMRPSAQAKTSSAGGLFQVVDSTWKEFGGNPKKKLDADENIRVGTDIIAKNTQTLRNLLKRDPRPAEVYAAHYFGPSGARNFLTADPATPIVDILGKAVVRANPNLQGKTVSQVMAQLEKKMGSGPAPAANVSRETSAPPARKPLPESLPPMAAAPARAAPAATMASLGPGYQAAMALSFLAGSGGADTEDDEKEEERVSALRRAERSEGIAAQYLAQIEGAARPAAGGLFADVQIRSPFAPLDEVEQPQQPQMLGKGGEVGDPYAQLVQDAPKRRVSLAEMGRGGLDTAAGMLKGATQAGIGTAGDIESLGRMLFGAKPDTFLPTTDETKKLIDRFAPLGLPADAGTDGRTAAEYFGEFLSPAAATGPLVRGAQAVGSGVMEGARQAERALEAPVTRTMERGGRAAEMLQALSAPPAFAVRSGKIKDIIETVRNLKGNYGARRVERAADEIPNLEEMYKEEALKDVFAGRNIQGGVITLNPAEFEQYAALIIKNRKSDLEPSFNNEVNQYNTLTDKYIDYLSRLPQGFNEVPYLNLSKDSIGLPYIPQIIGHEGRHRSRALAGRGEKASLVKINPRGDLMTELPTGTQEEYIEALKKEIERTGRLVLPEKNVSENFLRPLIELPEIYAAGGMVEQQSTDNRKYAEGGEVTDPEAALFAGRKDVPAKPNMSGMELAQQLMLGAGELPYLYGGAAVDLASLALMPFGYKEEKPFLGSEYLKDKATKFGIRAPDTTEDRLKGPRVAAEMLASLTNPAGATRSAVLAAEKGASNLMKKGTRQPEIATAASQLGAIKVPGKTAEPIFSPIPSADAPFVGRLDEMVANLQGPVQKDQFLGMLKGKMRDYDIARAKATLKDLPGNAKLTPVDLLNRIKTQYDPAQIRTTVRDPKDAPDNFNETDNPYKGQPVGVIHMSTFVSPEQAGRIKSLDQLDTRLFLASQVGYDSTAKVPGLDAMRTNAIANTQIAKIEEARQTLIDHSAPLFEAKRLMNEYEFPGASPAYNSKAIIEAVATAKQNNVPQSELTAYTHNLIMENIRRPAKAKMQQLLGTVPTNQLELKAAVRAKQGPLWDDQRRVLEMELGSMMPDIRRYFGANALKFGMESSYKGKDIHLGLEPPENAAGFSRFVEQTVQDPDRGSLKGIHLLEIQSDLTNELKAGVKMAQRLDKKEVFSDMPGNRRLVQQLGMKNAISAAINRGDQFVTFPGKESAKPQLYESVQDNLKAVAKDLGPGFEIRPFTFTTPQGTAMQHYGITWGPEAVTRTQQKGVPFKDGGAVERQPADHRRYL